MTETIFEKKCMTYNADSHQGAIKMLKASLLWSCLYIQSIINTNRVNIWSAHTWHSANIGSPAGQLPVWP